MTMTTKRARWFVGLFLAATLVVTGCARGTEDPHPPAAGISNPVSASFADTWADPSVIRGVDGWWYVYATQDPLKQGDPSRMGHIARTRDWRTWQYMGPILADGEGPSWASPTALVWAPDVRQVGDHYVMYYAVTDTVSHPEKDDSAIGAAVSTSPGGPWKPVDKPVVPPRPDGRGGWLSTIDPAGFTDVGGARYLYWGSYHGGVFAARLSEDGLHLTGSPVQVGHSDRYEGAYVVRHDGHYFLMASSANCCAGPATGYSVFVGRGDSPLGPFRDDEGVAMTASDSGGRVVLTQNGNRWIGAGHNAVMTDAAGVDHIVYHAIDHNKPWLEDAGGINRRPLLIDRLDWIDGWPVVNAGSGPSQGVVNPPITSSLLGEEPWAPTKAFDGVGSGKDAVAGQTATVSGRQAVSRRELPSGNLRLTVDLTTASTMSVALGEDLRVDVDSRAGTVRARGRGAAVSATFPAGQSWRTLTIDTRGNRARIQLGEAGLGDPVVDLSVNLAQSFRGGPVRVGGQGSLGYVAAAQTLGPATRMAAQPEPVGTARHVDLGSAVAGRDGWQWVRRPSGVTVSGAAVTWPLTDGDLAGEGGSGGLLLSSPPTGDWIAQVRVRLDLGVDSVRNYQQAGMVVIADDDDFIRLGAVAVEGTRIVEYGRELTDSEGFLSYGGAVVGRPTPTTWLRIAHHVATDGTHLYRAAISRDGRSWRWGATWTMPADRKPRIGLYAAGGAKPAVSAAFDNLNVGSARWPS